MTDLFSPLERPARVKIGQANGEFLAHLAEVATRRQTLNWLRTKWTSEVNAKMAQDNLKHWGLK